MKRGQRPRVLLLSAGCLVGQNVLASLEHRRGELRLIATGSLADEPVLFCFDEIHMAPPVRARPDAFAARFEEILAQCEPDLVIPCRDDDVSFLAQWRDRNATQAQRLVCGSSAVATAFLDKVESERFSRRHRLPFVPTLDPAGAAATAQQFAAAHGYPLIAKPREGFASRGVRLILNDEQLERLCRQPGFVVQKYLGDGDAVRAFAREFADYGPALFHTLEEIKVSVQACIAPDGSVSGVFVSGNEMRQGRSERVRAVDDPHIARVGHGWARTFSDAGWRGPLNIQCQHDAGGGLAIYEYNGRFTGATAARRQLGFDEVGLVLRDWLGLPVPDNPASGSTVVRYPVGRAVDSRAVDRLTRDGHWRAPHD